MNETPALYAVPAIAPHVDVWQPLPVRGRVLFRLSFGFWLALLGAAAGTAITVLLAGLFETSIWMGPVIGLLAGALYGIWLGGRRHRRYAWKLDEEGFALRRGNLWQTVTFVPATRVQHLDIKRGPLERGRDLSTLVIHTAGVRLSSVSVPCLGQADAEYLRAALAANIEADGDDD